MLASFFVFKDEVTTSIIDGKLAFDYGNTIKMKKKIKIIAVN